MTDNSFQVLTVWRYPVKSMQGEELYSSMVGDRGVIGDRAYALVDIETGKVVSAKNPKKWPAMFFCRSGYMASPTDSADPVAYITLPDGSQLRSDDETAAEKLTELFGRKVRLEKQAPTSASLEQYWPEHEGQSNEITDEAVAAGAMPGTFFDYAPVHLITTSTLRQLRLVYPEGRFEVRRFRPNIVIDTGVLEGFVENDWVGKTLQIGNDLRLQVTSPCPRCVMTTLQQGDLPKDPAIFNKGVVQNNVHVPFAGKALPSVGIYANVLSPGVAARNVSVKLL